MASHAQLQHHPDTRLARSSWIVIGLLAWCSMARADGQSSARPPNILLIVSDDQGYGDLGCYGSRDVLTPHLDQLASEGVRLTQFYVAWPGCTPSRASLLTGRYPQRHGLYDMVRNEAPDYGKHYTPTEYRYTFERIGGLDTREVLLSELLQAADYTCGVVGKWDLGMQRRFLPLSRGFSFFYGFVNTGIDYFTHERYGVPSMYRGYEPTTADQGTYTTDLFEREAIRFIEQHANGPFFLYLAFNAPHSASNLDPAIRGAAQATPELQAKYPQQSATYVEQERDGQIVRRPSREHRRLNHMASITGMDQSIGRVLALLSKLGVRENTFVFFLSDHGASRAGDNGGLRGGKAHVWEGGVRVPSIVSCPARLPQGTECDAMLSSLEFVPTALALAGLEKPADLALDGHNMLPVVEGKKDKLRESMFWQRRDLKAARVGKWKWVHTPDGEHLFDLQQDPREANNLAERHPRQARELAAAFGEWQSQMEASPPRDPFRDY